MLIRAVFGRMRMKVLRLGSVDDTLCLAWRQRAQRGLLICESIGANANIDAGLGFVWNLVSATWNPRSAISPRPHHPAATGRSDDRP